MKNKNHRLLQVGLLTVAGIFLLCRLGSYPLVDYDEATYAEVVRDTSSSGDLASLHYQGSPWFEKPPLYFWLAIDAVKIFGENEFALRLPSAACGWLGLWLVWLITKKMTTSSLAATCAFLILLFSPPFYYYCREARLDAGLTASIMLALYAVVMGWEKEKYLLLLFPAVAAGLMFKSAPALLAVPIILIFSAVFRRWQWLGNRYLWWGLLPAGVIVVPWHIIQTVRFGQEFWHVYFGYHILRRALYGMSDKTTATATYYLKLLWSYYQPWILLLPIACAYAIASCRRRLRHRFLIMSSIFAALCILLIFTFARTQLFPYIIPFYPLSAIFLAVVFHDMAVRFQEAKTILYATGAIMLAVGALLGLGVIGTFTADVVKPYNYEEKNLSVLVRNENSNHAPVYVLQWSHVKTIEYYTGQIVKTSKGDGLFTPPFYLIAPKQIMAGLFDARGDLLPQLGKLRKVYEGDRLVTLYSGQNLQLAPTGEKTFIPD